MDMRETEYKEFEYRMFFTNPISKLELLTNSSGERGDVILSMNVDNLPENKSKALKNVNPSIQTIPVSITQYDLKNCIDQLRLRLHEFLN